ncbi:unnamed protein product [Blepharisma stoltei]|uniref:Lebercilin domain-containing protein n=1 Tax=Blepharisma stoltei TaxID=1481888 RepID=A0AAU9IPA2_9CILI|nr:unnamed protein product [Blepharisma stoltei]
MNGFEENQEGNNLDPVIAIDKLKKQNEKLRSELKVLSRALDEALDKQKKQERERARVPPREEGSTETEKELQTSLARINKYKKDIANMKKQLDGNLNESKITDLENQSKYLSKRIQELEAENASLMKIEKEQKKALDSANNAQGYPEKVESLKQEIKSLKERYRELLSRQKQDEKILKEQHEKCVDLEEKCRKIKAMIKQKKQEEDEPKPKEITERDIRELEEKIKETEQKKKEEEQKLKKRIKELESQVKESRYNINTLNIKLKEKDQECRLSMLKIKELRRAVRHNQLKPIPRPENNESVNNSRQKVMKSQESINSKNSDENIRFSREARKIKDLKSRNEKSQESGSDIDEYQGEIGRDTPQKSSSVSPQGTPQQDFSERFEQPIEPAKKAEEADKPAVFSKPNFRLR